MAKKGILFLWAVIWIWLKAPSENKSQSSIQNQFNQWTTSAGFYLSKYIAAFSLIYKKKLHQTKKTKKINFNNFNLLLDRRINGQVFFNRTERQIQRERHPNQPQCRETWNSQKQIKLSVSPGPKQRLWISVPQKSEAEPQWKKVKVWWKNTPQS